MFQTTNQIRYTIKSNEIAIFGWFSMLSRSPIGRFVRRVFHQFLSVLLQSLRLT